MIRNIFIILLVFLTFSGCKKSSLKEVEQLTKEKNSANEIAYDIEFIVSDSAKVKAKLTAPKMEVFSQEGQYAVLPDGLEIVFYDNHLHPNAFCSANYGMRKTREKVITLRDSVVVVNLKGDTLNTEELIWDERSDKVFSKKFVKVRTKTEIIKSEGFESDPTFSYYKFYKIRGVIGL